MTGEDGKTIYSDIIGIELKKKAQITKQPQNVMAALGEDATFEISAENAKSYEWQYSYNGEPWTAYSWIEGYDSPKFTMGVNEARAACKIRCAVTGEDGNTIFSFIVKISVIKKDEWELPIQ